MANKKMSSNKNLLIIGGIILLVVAFFMFNNKDDEEKTELVHVGFWDAQNKHVYCLDSDGTNTNNKGTLQLFDDKENPLVNIMADYCVDDKSLAEFICFPENLNEDGTEKDPNIETNDIFYIPDWLDCLNKCEDGRCV